MSKLQQMMAGNKVYVLMGVGVLVALAQYFSGMDMGMPMLPPAHSVGELVQQVFVFATGAAGRAAVAKVGQ